jgi:hypothetical protein
MTNIYTDIDYLLKEYDLCTIEYNKLVDHILYLWNNVIIEYLDDTNNIGNGFLNKIRNDKKNGLDLFFKFICEKSLVGKQVFNNYNKSYNKLIKYISDNNEILNNVCDKNNYTYILDKQYDTILQMENEHIILLKEKYNQLWEIEYNANIKPFYDNCKTF